MPEPPDDIRPEEINGTYAVLEKNLVDEVNKRHLSFIEIEIVMLYLRKRLDAEEMGGFNKYVTAEEIKSKDMYS